MTTRIWTGTASVVSGYTTVVLSGDPLTDANCPADATIVLGGATYFVSERVDTTTVELTRPYEGVDDSAITAEIDPMSTTTTSLVTLSTQLSTYNARLALLDANGRGLFYKSKGYTGANDPGAGYMGRNATDWADVTALYFDILDQNGQDKSHLLDLLTSGDIFIVRSIATDAVADYRVNTVTDETGWYSVGVTYLGGTDIIADEEDIAVEMRRVGSGIEFDAQTATEAGLPTYEGQAVGYKVLVGDYAGSGRAAVFTLLESGSPTSWSDPAYVTGPQGDTGDAATVAVGTVTTLAAGSSATVENSGTSAAAVLDFGIPQGAKGDTGDAATIAVGTVTTLDPGQSATVENVGTSAAATFNFGIPKGDGLDYDVQVATIADREAYEGQAAGYRVLVTDVGDGRAAIYELITSGSPSDWSDPIYLTGESGTNIWDAIVDDPSGLELYESEGVGYRVLVSDVGNGRSAIYQLQSQGSPSDWFGPIYLTGATGEVSGAVASVNGQDGIVVLDAEDIAFDPTGSPTGTLESTTVQDAIVELDFEKGIVWEVVEGVGISVDNSDPAAPVVSLNVDASGIAFSPDASSPSSGLISTDVQSAIEEINDAKVSFADVLDEDDMLSDDPLRPPSQQSVKAYVDANAGGVGIQLARNGSFAVSQRVTMPTADNAYCLDGWRLLLENANGATVAQETVDVPVGAGFACKLTVGSGNNGKFGIFSPIDSRNMLSLRGGVCSLLVPLKATSGLTDGAGKIRVGIVQWGGTADDVAADPISSWGAEGTNPTLILGWSFANTPAALAVTSSWADFLIENVPIASNATNIGILVWSDDRTNTATSDELLVGGYVTLTKGASASAAIVLPFEDELRRCQRRYFLMAATAAYSYFAAGQIDSATQFQGQVTFPVPMAKSPTLEETGTASEYGIYQGGAVTACSSVVTRGSVIGDDNAGYSSCTVIGTASGLTVGRAAHLVSNNNTTAYLAFNADL